MGSRISIKLKDLFQPDIKVVVFYERLEPQTSDEAVEYVHCATVEFQRTDFVWTGTLSGGMEALTVEGDFNFFRHEEGNRALMRSLFHHSVPFHVIPG